MDRKRRRENEQRDASNLSQKSDEILSLLREIRELVRSGNNIRYTDDDYRELLEMGKRG